MNWKFALAKKATIKKATIKTEQVVSERYLKLNPLSTESNSIQKISISDNLALELFSENDDNKFITIAESDDEVSIVNTSAESKIRGAHKNKTFKVNKDNTINSKYLFSRLTTKLDLDSKLENLIEMSEVIVNGGIKGSTSVKIIAINSAEVIELIEEKVTEDIITAPNVMDLPFSRDSNENLEADFHKGF